MAFRRRGYERDALLQAVIQRAGYAGLMGSASERQEGKKLATLPDELARFDLENFRDRPVQAELMTLLLLTKAEAADRFTSCVLVHGMGGTGKTATAVAVNLSI